MTQRAQPYDSSLKSLLEGQAADVISHLVPGAIVEEELNSEVLKPPLRADRIYRGRYKNCPCVMQVELETASNSEMEMEYRLLEYFGILIKAHRKRVSSVVSIVLYPFRARIPQSPLRIFLGNEEWATLHFVVVPLWHLNARTFVEKGAVSVYALLPTMQDATYEVLAQALDAMKT